MTNIAPRTDTITAADGTPLAARLWRHAPVSGPEQAQEPEQAQLPEQAQVPEHGHEKRQMPGGGPSRQTARPRGHVVFTHGIISHGGWYTQSCQTLADRGYDVTFLDRRGSGLNQSHRGDVDRSATWLSDVEDFLAELPADRPRVLIGISWGGKLVAEIAKRRPDLIDGLGLICPGIYARQFPPPWKYRLLGGMARAGGRLLRVPIPLRDPTLFTDVPHWQQFIATDEQTLRKVTVRFALADRELTDAAREQVEHIHVPTMMMLAGRDRIVDNDAMRVFFAKIATPHKRLIEYPDAAHTFEFEPDPTTYLRDLTTWVESIMSAMP